MARAGSRFFRVIVRRNLVCEIRPIAEAEAHCTEDDPLVVSSLLAQNNLKNGCLDGVYDFASFEAARHFATLCADFLQKLCDKSLEAMNRLERPEDGPWHNPFIPTPPSDEERG